MAAIQGRNAHDGRYCTHLNGLFAGGSECGSHQRSLCGISVGQFVPIAVRTRLWALLFTATRIWACQITHDLAREASCRPAWLPFGEQLLVQLPSQLLVRLGGLDTILLVKGHVGAHTLLGNCLKAHY